MLLFLLLPLGRVQAGNPLPAVAAGPEVSLPACPAIMHPENRTLRELRLRTAISNGDLTEQEVQQLAHHPCRPIAPLPQGEHNSHPAGPPANSRRFWRGQRNHEDKVPLPPAIMEAK
jgi:hypothetical protein